MARRSSADLRATSGLVLLVLLVSGCTHVAPYERGKLAHPTMDLESGATSTAEHVHAVHEGAAGGASAAAGGCGCN